jgi:hypothetical protein
MQAMKGLKASNPNLTFPVTLPVLTSGLTNDGVNILKAARTAGVKIDVVNITPPLNPAGSTRQRT